jgi:hypothetical protein
MQELDAARRAAILRGQTPPPLPEDADKKDAGRKRERDDRGHDRKRRKLAGEDDTDMDIRLAATVTAPADDDKEDARVLKLRDTKIDAPLTNHAGNIDLFPVDLKEATKREKNAEVEKEMRRQERAFEDQYTMRFSNAAGREGLDKPWYAAQQKPPKHDDEDTAALDYLENKNVWGNEDPRRREREQARIVSSDPFAFMQQAQNQLKRSKEDKKKWAAERDRELRELRATQEREDRRSRHQKRKRKDEQSLASISTDEPQRSIDRARSKHKYGHRNGDRSCSPDRVAHRSSHRHERRGSRSRSRDLEREDRRKHSSSRHTRHDRHEDKRRI